jgi:bifunctional NMN adenylyltransferase/nudix hydrolase
MFPQWTFKKMPYLHNLDATNIRNEWYCSGNIEVYAQYIMPSTFNHIKRFEASSLIDEYKFIEEHTKMWSVAPYPVSFTTVDSLVIKSGCILVIKRGTKLGFGQYALAGGYLNMNESIRDGALRELKEETKISVPFSVLENSIKEVRVFDHPKRSLRGRIVTHVHLIDLGYGPLPEVKGGDDANEAVWLPIADVMQNEDKFFEDHYDIIVNMTSKY